MRTTKRSAWAATPPTRPRPSAKPPRASPESATSAVTVGQSITDTATLAGGFSPGGQLVFRAYGPGDATCATPRQIRSQRRGQRQRALLAGRLRPGAGPLSVDGRIRGRREQRNVQPRLRRGQSVFDRQQSDSGPDRQRQRRHRRQRDQRRSERDRRLLSGRECHLLRLRADRHQLRDADGNEQRDDHRAPTPPRRTSPQQAGGFRWTATYRGDANNEAISLRLRRGQPVLDRRQSRRRAFRASRPRPSRSARRSPTPPPSPAASAPAAARLPRLWPRRRDLRRRRRIRSQRRRQRQRPLLAGRASPRAGAVSLDGRIRRRRQQRSVQPRLQRRQPVLDRQQSLPGPDAAATAAAIVGNAINDNVTLTGGFSPAGKSPSASTARPTPSARRRSHTKHGRGPGNGPCYLGRLLAPGRRLPLDRRLLRATRTTKRSASAAAPPTRSSTVGKATPTLAGSATSATKVGQTITDSATLAGGFSPAASSSSAPTAPATRPAQRRQIRSEGRRQRQRPLLARRASPRRRAVSVGGRIRGRCEQRSDQPGCDAAEPVLGRRHGPRDPDGERHRRHGRQPGRPPRRRSKKGAIPTGQITFKAFPPSDTNCSGTAAFSSTVSVAGQRLLPLGAFPTLSGRQPSAGPSPTRATPTTPRRRSAAAKRPRASPRQSPRSPAAVKQRVYVGTPFRDTATLQGATRPAARSPSRSTARSPRAAPRRWPSTSSPSAATAPSARIRSSLSAPAATASSPATRATPRTRRRPSPATPPARSPRCASARRR